MKARQSKFSGLDAAIDENLEKYSERRLAAYLKETFNRPESEDSIRNYIKRRKKLLKEHPDLLTTSSSTTQGYESDQPLMPSAWDADNNRFYTVEEYCEKYGLPKDLIKSSKLVAHIGSHMIYNIVFKEEIHDIEDFDYMAALEEAIGGYKKKDRGKRPGSGSGVITLSDIHFGAYILALKNTPDFTIDILIDMLEDAANQMNRFKYEKVHVHLLGDLIESFTGMNHINTWHSLKQGMIGANVIKEFVFALDKHFLSKLNNLVDIKIVAGNHDRGTSRNDHDQKGWAADLISWGLKLMGYDTEFSTSVLSHTVDNINYILNHGHLGLTKMSTEEMCWNYGTKGKYNFVMEGHLHTRIAKLNAKSVKNFELITDDTVDCRRQVCPSLFTGNFWSETQGFTTKPGYLITEDNGRGGVNVFDFSL